MIHEGIAAARTPAELRLWIEMMVEEDQSGDTHEYRGETYVAIASFALYFNVYRVWRGSRTGQMAFHASADGAWEEGSGPSMGIHPDYESLMSYYTDTCFRLRHAFAAPHTP